MMRQKRQSSIAPSLSNETPLRVDEEVVPIRVYSAELDRGGLRREADAALVWNRSARRKRANHRKAETSLYYIKAFCAIQRHGSVRAVVSRAPQTQAGGD